MVDNQYIKQEVWVDFYFVVLVVTGQSVCEKVRLCVRSAQV